MAVAKYKTKDMLICPNCIKRKKKAESKQLERKRIYMLSLKLLIVKV